MLAALLGCAVAAQQAAEHTTILKVSGMSCGECAKTVEKDARTIDGVKKATVSQPKGEAEIVYDPAKTSPEAIAKRINEKTGFKAEVPKKDSSIHDAVGSCSSASSARRAARAPITAAATVAASPAA